MSRAVTQDLEHHHRIADPFGRWRDRSADYEGVRIADTAGNHDFQVAAMRLAWRSAQPRHERRDDVHLDGRVRGCAARQGEWLDAIELVPQLLPVLPGQELLQRHGCARS